MSAAVTPADQDAAPDRADRSVPLLIAAAVLLIAVVVGVVLFGVQRPPTLAALTDEPTPAVSSQVAWVDWTGERTCLRIGEVDGRVRDVRCGGLDGDLVAWTEDGLLMTGWDGRMLTVDPRTGATSSRAGILEPAGHVATVTRVERDDQHLRVILESGDSVEGADVELWRTEAPDAYDVRASSRSLDGRWVALVDTADRLLVVPADGSSAPRVWASGVDHWQAPVWEGTGRD